MNANDKPPPEAYGLSEPERYRVLHSAANRLVHDLVDGFDVVIHEGAALDAQSARIVEAERSVKLAPVSPAAAPITLALTSFPGLNVQFGRWEARSYPSCGCDACDEDPAELIHQLRRDVKAVVDGNFCELRGGLRPWKAMELWGDEWRSSHHGALRRREMRRLGPAGRHEWRPWPRRAAGGSQAAPEGA